MAYLLGEATRAEQDALQEWRSVRPANDAEYRRQRYAWDRLGELKEARRPRGVGSIKTQTLKSTRYVAWSAAMAAALALAFLGPWARQAPSGSALGAEDVVTGSGEVVTLTLRDGTVVRLGPESRLSFSGARGPRDVLLEGKAYFAVPHMAEDPFRVHTEAGDVKVLGTRFEVEARGGGVQIVVVEGEVEAGQPENRVSIRRGQMGRLDEFAPPILASVENVYLATAWIGEFTAFESTPLSEVIDELQARFDLNIEITDEVLASRTVSGLFINQPPEEMVISICLAVDARCSRTGETIQMWLGQVVPGAAG